MKVQIETEQLYKITINGVSHEGFKKVAEWEGLAKFQNQEGVLIIDLPEKDIGEDFLKMMSTDRINANPIEADLVKASPSLFPIKGK